MSRTTDFLGATRCAGMAMERSGATSPILKLVDCNAILSSRCQRGVQVFAISGKRQADEVCLPSRLFVATKPIISEIAQLIVAEVKDCDRLPDSTLFYSIPLVEQRRVTTVWTQRDGCRVAVGASNKAGDWDIKHFARRKINVVCPILSPRYNEYETKTNDHSTKSRGYFSHSAEEFFGFSGSKAPLGTIAHASAVVLNGFDLR